MLFVVGWALLWSWGGGRHTPPTSRSKFGTGSKGSQPEVPMVCRCCKALLTRELLRHGGGHAGPTAPAQRDGQHDVAEPAPVHRGSLEGMTKAGKTSKKKTRSVGKAGKLATWQGTHYFEEFTQWIRRSSPLSVPRSCSREKGAWLQRSALSEIENLRRSLPSPRNHGRRRSSSCG